MKRVSVSPTAAQQPAETQKEAVAFLFLVSKPKVLRLIKQENYRETIISNNLE